MIRGGSFPLAASAKASAAMRVMFARLSCVTPAVCWVTMTFAMFSSGWPGFGGSCSHTSSPAPARWPLRSASCSAGSSWMLPRAVVTKMAPWRICAKLPAFIRLRLSGDSGRCRLTTSLSASSSGISTLRAPRAAIVAASR